MNKAAAAIAFTPTASTQTRIEKQLDAGNWVFVGVTGETVGAAVIAGLAKAGSYTFRIRAENASGVSTWVTVAHTTPALATVAVPPLAPTGLVVDNITHARARFSWTENATNEGFYTLVLRAFGNEKRVTVSVFENPVTLDLSAEFGTNVAAAQITAYVFGYGGQAKAARPPLVASAPTADVVFVMSPAAIRITSAPAESTAYTALAFSATIRCDSNAITLTTSALPTGLSLTFTGPAATATITGTTTAAPGRYPVTITATNASGTDTENIVINVVKSKLNFTAGTPVLYFGVIGTEFTKLFTFDVLGTAVPTGPLTADQLPDWLSITDFALSGNPTEASDDTFTLTVTNGTLTETLRIRVIVPTIRITNADNLSTFVGQVFSFALAALPAGAEFSSDDMPNWLSITPKSTPTTAQFMTGTPTAAGVYEFTLTATLGENLIEQDFTLTVQTAIEGPSSVSIQTDTPVNEGPFIYVGTGTVSSWILTGAPDGLTIGWDLYGGIAGNTAYILGTTTRSGIYNATVSVMVTEAGKAKRYNVPVRLYVSGGLFLAWLHEDPAIYDLQVSLRGDAVSRVVHSFYETAPVLGTKSITTVQNGTTTVTENVPTQVVGGNVLSMKRHDQIRLALVVRDGPDAVSDGITNMAFTLRLGEDVDEDYVLDVAGVSTVINDNTVFIAEFEVTNEFIEELTGGDDLSTIALFGEISFTYSGLDITSRTFPVTLIEDIRR